MKKVVLYGAGNIGRGFLGQLFYENDYEIVFVDINEEVINELNKRHSYPVKIVSTEKIYEVEVKNARIVNGNDMETVAQEIATCDIMCSAVGVNVLKFIIPNLCAGIKKRSIEGKDLNIIICENLIGADEYIKSMIKEQIGKEYHEFVDNHVGFVEASVGRMVPIMTEEMKEGDILKVWVEPFCTLPVDREAFKGEVPEFKGIKPENGFSYYIQSKLFLHNMGHAICAYLGKLLGYTYIYEAIKDEKIHKVVKEAFYASAKALSMEHGRSYEEVKAYADDLLFRFSNIYLKDTVLRVGRDLKRKLAKNDRLVGAALLCEKHGIDNTAIKTGIAAAFKFGEEFDKSTLAIEVDEHLIDDIIK